MLKYLASLCCADNGLGKEGIESLVTGLHTNSTLTFLDLSSNNMEDQGCEILCDALAPVMIIFF